MAERNIGGDISAVNSTKTFSVNSNYLVFNVTPENATITVDDRQYKPEPDGSLTLFVSRGTHSYEATAEGYVAERGEVTVGQQRTKVVIKLQKE